MTRRTKRRLGFLSAAIALGAAGVWGVNRWYLRPRAALLAEIGVAVAGGERLEAEMLDQAAVKKKLQAFADTNSINVDLTCED